MRKFYGFLENLLIQLKPPQQLEEASTQVTLAEAFQGPVSVLASRAGVLLRFAGISAAVAFVAGAVALICYAVGWSHLPTSAIDQILIPDHAAVIFEPATVSQGGNRAEVGFGTISGVGESFGSANALLYDLATGWFLRGLGIVAVVFGVFMGMIRQDFTPFILALPILAMPSVMGAMLEISDPELADRKEETPAENQLLVAAENKDYLTIKKLLRGEDGIDDFTKMFILSQAAIAAKVHEPKVLLATTKDLRSSTWANLKRETRSGKPGFSIVPQVAYALEMAADGTVSNRKARTYEKESLKSSAAWKSAGWLAVLVAVFFGVMAVGPLSLSQIISMRLRRLRELFQQAEDRVI